MIFRESQHAMSRNRTRSHTQMQPRLPDVKKRLIASPLLGLSLTVLPLVRSRAENEVSYRYEDYSEDDGRVHIRTHGFLFGADLKPWLTLKGNYIYDGISGATPTGAPTLHGEKDFATASIEDIRRAGFIEAAFKLNQHTFTPQLAYSEESDYRSVGVSLNHSIDLNEKNTTLTWGISHAFDQVLPNPGESITTKQDKNATDFLLGITQLLGPNTIFRANLTLGYSHGYLSDPYKRAYFEADGVIYDHPDETDPIFRYTVWPEIRPRHKFRQVAYLSLQHFVTPLQGAVEVSYRFHHDDWDVIANTLTLQWHQKIGKHVTLSPLFRYHQQTEASFYGTRFPGDPAYPPGLPDSALYATPQHYSADYRLSALDSYTFGVSASIQLHEKVSLEFGYKRYEMSGRDRETNAGQYPSAHVFTGGLSLWF